MKQVFHLRSLRTRFTSIGNSIAYCNRTHHLSSIQPCQFLSLNTLNCAKDFTTRSTRQGTSTTMKEKDKGVNKVKSMDATEHTNNMNTVPTTATSTDSTKSQKHPQTNHKFSFVLGAYDICHRDKQNHGGEDAHSLITIISESKNSKTNETTRRHVNHAKSSQTSHNTTAATAEASVLAVFDGVGSLSFEKNINVRAYAQAINVAVQNAVETEISKGSHDIDPYEILKSGYEEVRTKHIVGSSTACVISLKNNRLTCANVGDSGFLLLRPTEKVVTAILQPVISEANEVEVLINAQIKEQDKHQPTVSLSPISLPISLLTPLSSGNKPYTIVYRSPQQLHYFNCPAALSVLNGRKGEIDNTMDAIHDAIRLQLHVEPNDIIILATDGLFDNVFEEDMLHIVGEELGGFEDTEITQEMTRRLAERLAKRAHDLSMNKSIDCPFALAAKDSNILWRGGRPDDITVMVGFVKKAPV
jgi:serine/threonine protein phosphatase PrpC